MAIPLATYLEMQRRQEAYQRAQRQQTPSVAATGIAGGGSAAFQAAMQATPTGAGGGSYTSTASYMPNGVMTDDPRMAPVIAALGAQATQGDADIRARATAGLEGARNLANMNIDKMASRNAASRGLSGRDGVSDQYRAEVSAPILASLADVEGRMALQGYDQRAGVGSSLLAALNSGQNARNQLAMQAAQFEWQKQQAQLAQQQQSAIQQALTSQAGRPMGPALNDVPGWAGGVNTFLQGGGGGGSAGVDTVRNLYNDPNNNMIGRTQAQREQAMRDRENAPARPAGSTYNTSAQTANRPLGAGVGNASDGYNFTGNGTQPATGWTVGMPAAGAVGYNAAFNAMGHAQNTTENTISAAGMPPGASMW